MTTDPPDPMTAASADRRARLAENLAALRRRVERACAAAGRPAGGVSVIAVTKTYPATDVRLLAALGIRDVGENRDQEARGKLADLRDVPVRWHFVGGLQRNKARSVAGWADVVHSVDRSAIVAALGRAAVERDRPLLTLVQVSLEDHPAPGRAGAPAADVQRLADEIATTDGLQLGGVMAVAPRLGDPGSAFARLAVVAGRVRAAHPDAIIVSAGMSADLESAVRHGATHLRIGTALLGARSTPVR